MDGCSVIYIWLRESREWEVSAGPNVAGAPRDVAFWRSSSGARVHGYGNYRKAVFLLRSYRTIVCVLPVHTNT